MGTKKLFYSLSSPSTNFLIVGDDRYFLLTVANGVPIFVPDRCPHRGGPLHLGKFVEDGRKIKCPWHRYCWRKESIERKFLPVIVNRQCLTLAIPKNGNKEMKIKEIHKAFML
ncbi:Rieske (2Fe-2S) protein [Franzmannia pantelleriensis]|uniref:Rieske (2Fe-2S) protein n=1 Tax=Franzmannia pantelleriensis TaxID=48727 RepID=UPI000B7C596A|nr:Rieske 2Fe-2S domain-containing protein [Halomonas pantelleriensis]